MLKYHIKRFTLLLAIIIFFIILKNGKIFDLGIFFRLLQPNIPFNILMMEPDSLEESYKNLLIDNTKLKYLEDENKELRELLDFSQKKNYTLKVANILSRDELNKNILIIDIGKNKNIKEGQAVVISNGIIIGKVIEVNSITSKIRLLTDKKSTLAIKIGEESVSGILTGSLGLGMYLEYIPQEQDIKINNLILTSNLNENIPANLLIGKIEKIEFEKDDIFKKALISPLIDYNTLFLVSIINL
jgi:rod shape-determining protein MreC